MPGETRNPSPSLSAALSRLPLPSPPADGWPMLRLALSKRAALKQQRRRRGVGLALAASIGLLAALLLPAYFSAPAFDPKPSQPAAAVADGSTIRSYVDPLNGLIAQSAQLEAQLSWLSGSSLGGDAFGIDLALVDRLQWIDQLLADDAPTNGTTEVLWRERVQLLTRRVALSQREVLIAAVGDPANEPTL